MKKEQVAWYKIEILVGREWLSDYRTNYNYTTRHAARQAMKNRGVSNSARIVKGVVVERDLMKRD